MAKRISGICYVSVDGSMLSLKSDSGLDCTMADVTRTEELSTHGVVGYSETPVAPSISGEFYVDQAFPMEKLQKESDMTVTAELANGKVFTLSGAFVSGDAMISGSSGTISLKFVGEKGIWN